MSRWDEDPMGVDCCDCGGSLTRGAFPGDRCDDCETGETQRRAVRVAELHAAEAKRMDGYYAESLLPRPFRKRGRLVGQDEQRD